MAEKSLDPGSIQSALQAAFPVLYQRLTTRFRDPQLAEEVSWDCLTHAYEVWRSDPHFFDSRDLTSWSSQRAAWRALDRLRQRTRFAPLVEEGDEDAPGGPTLPVLDLQPAEARNHDRLVTWECLALLDDEERFILVEHYYEGRSDQEIGSDLYGNEGSAQARGLRVWRRRQKAQGRLRDLLLAHGIDPVEYADPMAQAL